MNQTDGDDDQIDGGERLTHFLPLFAGPSEGKRAKWATEGFVRKSPLQGAGGV